MSQEPLQLSVLYAIFVQEGCGGEPQLVGLISDMELNAKELADYKRAHRRK